MGTTPKGADRLKQIRDELREGLQRDFPERQATPDPLQRRVKTLVRCFVGVFILAILAAIMA